MERYRLGYDNEDESVTIQLQHGKESIQISQREKQINATEWTKSWKGIRQKIKVKKYRYATKMGQVHNIVNLIGEVAVINL